MQTFICVQNFLPQASYFNPKCLFYHGLIVLTILIYTFWQFLCIQFGYNFMSRMMNINMDDLHINFYATKRCERNDYSVVLFILKQDSNFKSVALQLYLHIFNVESNSCLKAFNFQFICLLWQIHIILNSKCITNHKFSSFSANCANSTLFSINLYWYWMLVVVLLLRDAAN